MACQCVNTGTPFLSLVFFLRKNPPPVTSLYLGFFKPNSLNDSLTSFQCVGCVGFVCVRLAPARLRSSICECVLTNYQALSLACSHKFLMRACVRFRVRACKIKFVQLVDSLSFQNLKSLHSFALR